MSSLRVLIANALAIANYRRETRGLILPYRFAIGGATVSFPVTLSSIEAPSRITTVLRSYSRSDPQEEEDSEAFVEDITIPEHWLAPSKALEESEWLRVTLHKWLDEEYCPEATNVEISNVASQAFYKSLLRKETDLGKILLSMARELETISYQESFHGAFSSANAALSLIYQRIEKA